MALTVLIVEDEQSASRLLTAIAHEVGLSARTTASGREAQQLCAEAHAGGAPFSAVVLDLVLAELDGFQFATAARASDWGAALPLLIVSGVYKQLPPDFAAKAKPAAFFAKPFEPAALRAALTKLTGSQGAVAALEGRLEQKRAAALFVDLLRGRLTGVLTCSHEGSRRLITFQQGMIRFAQSNVKAETVGAPQVAAGLIKQTSFDRAVALAKQQGVSLHEALASARVLTPDQLKVALKQQAADVCVGALKLREGDFRFDPKQQEAVSNLPDLRQSPVPLILEAAKESDPASRKWLEERSQERLHRSAELEREMFALKSSWPGEGVTAVATGGRTVAEVLARAKEAELPLLHCLCVSGLVTLSGAAKTAASAQPAASADASEEDRGKTFTPPEVAARRMLFGQSDHLREASHYELLGVPETAEVEDVKRAYFVAAKRYHSDSFSGLNLGSAQRVAEELFGRINEAYSVLSDKEQRAEYDVFLDRKEKGLPTDVGAILRAEGLFQKGEAFFKMGRYDDAEVQFREAIALNHAEAEFHAYLGMAIFKRTGKPYDGLPHVEKALELDARLHSGNLFCAQMLEAGGDPDGARNLLRKALEKDPDFGQGKDELKRLRNKPLEDSKGGFLSRLLKK
jgi:curved DNA-binding protein CbpA/DNA-binding response OmpR family regulator